MTHGGKLQATRTADTEVFYMAGRQLAALSRRLREAGWALETPVNVVSRAGCSDQLASDHTVLSLGEAALLHVGRPAVVTVGVGAEPLAAHAGSRQASTEHTTATTAARQLAGTRLDLATNRAAVTP
jgi:uroporphyrin-III C-methyltransferase